MLSQIMSLMTDIIVYTVSRFNDNNITFQGRNNKTLHDEYSKTKIHVTRSVDIPLQNKKHIENPRDSEHRK